MNIVVVIIRGFLFNLISFSDHELYNKYDIYFIVQVFFLFQGFLIIPVAL